MDGSRVDRHSRLEGYRHDRRYMQLCNRLTRESPPARTLATMTQLAFVFPGQGSQSVGMGRALAETSPAAAAVFAAADRALSELISAVAWDGPAGRLDQTEQAQPAILATSIAILAALRERWAAEGSTAPEPAFAAGHSMGQYPPSSPRALSTSKTASGWSVSADG